MSLNQDPAFGQIPRPNTVFGQIVEIFLRLLRGRKPFQGDLLAAIPVTSRGISFHIPPAIGHSSNRLDGDVRRQIPLALPLPSFIIAARRALNMVHSAKSCRQLQQYSMRLVGDCVLALTEGPRLDKGIQHNSTMK